MTGAKLQKGDILRLQSPAGGDYMPMEEQNLAMVLEDVKKGCVSIEAAKNIYGVEV